MFSTKTPNCFMLVKGNKLRMSNYFFFDNFINDDFFYIHNVDIKKAFKIKNKYNFQIEICNNYTLTYLIE